MTDKAPNTLTSNSRRMASSGETSSGPGVRMPAPQLSRSHVLILSKELSELRASSVKSLLASFGTEREFLDADESRILDTDEAQKRPKVCLRIERLSCAPSL